jgi:hypothetical protein
MSPAVGPGPDPVKGQPAPPPTRRQRVTLKVLQLVATMIGAVFNVGAWIGRMLTWPLRWLGRHPKWIPVAVAVYAVATAVDLYAMGRHAGTVAGRDSAIAEMQAHQTAHLTAPSPTGRLLPDPPSVDVSGRFCGGRIAIIDRGHAYLLLFGAGPRDGRLVDMQLRGFAERCGDGGEGDRALIYIGYDRDSGGCVKYARVEGQSWILSSGVALIHGRGRLVDVEEHGASSAYSCAGKPAIPPIEDSAGYALDRTVSCGFDEAFYVPALRSCLGPEQLKGHTR